MSPPAPSYLTRALLWLVLFYRNSFGIMMLQSCRMVPSCSTYALEALKAHGALRGMLKAARRLLRCHPLMRNLIDPVR
jgi:putative membrane protein insertion efficiency factor